SLGDSHADHCDAADRSRNLEQDYHAGENDLSPETARSLVELTLAEGDKARMNDQARKNREGVLTDDERKELASM
ncbi:MAG: hypothetical protein ACXVBY_17775, partial [Isosphaeraceae bacterium]